MSSSNEEARSFAADYLQTVSDSLKSLDLGDVVALVDMIASCRGRIFCLGCGGGAAHAEHMACDLRGLAKMESYCPTENSAVLTALANDRGWAASYVTWLRDSRASPRDLVMIFSVGGGCEKLSANIMAAVDYAKSRGIPIGAVVGRDGGHAGRHALACVKIPVADRALTTPVVESVQSVVAHLLVSHPKLSRSKPAWESIE